MLADATPKERMKTKSSQKKKPPSWTAKWGQAKAVLIALEPNSDIKNIMDHNEHRERGLVFNTSMLHFGNIFRAYEKEKTSEANR